MIARELLTNWLRKKQSDRRSPRAPAVRFTYSRCRVVLDGRADGAKDPADLRAQEDQGDDRHDRDEGEDQRVLRETLAFLVIPVKEIDDCGKELHLGRHLLSYGRSPAPEIGIPFPRRGVEREP